MSGLLAALQSAGGALDAYSRALQVTQQNLVNQSTPGYARQTPRLQSMPFQPLGGLFGGVQFAGAQDSRSEFAENSVRVQNSALGWNQQLDGLLQPILPYLNTQDVSNSTGLMADLQNWFAAVRQWDSTSGDAAARQKVLDTAGVLAGTFRDTAEAFRSARQDSLQQLQVTVGQVNSILGDLQQMQASLGGVQNDPGVEAAFYAKLEDLSQYMDIRVSQEANGQFTVTTAAGAALLMGDQAWPLKVSLQATPPSASFPTAGPTVQLLASDGTDISATAAGGRVGALLYGLTAIFPSLLGDATQQGDLNRLAEGFAGRVNQILTGGLISDNPPVAGVPLFAWDNSNPLTVAQTLTLAPGIDASQLALIRTQPNVDPLGIPAQLLGLVSGNDPADAMQLESQSFTDFLNGLGLHLAGLQSTARSEQSFHTQLLQQAQANRERVSGVSLEEESVNLLQFQRSFESIAKVISVLNTLTQTILDMVKPA